MCFKLQNISKSYGSHDALKDINLTIHQGEIHGLAGLNGSGKSTLLNILSGQPGIHQTGGFSGKFFFKDQELVLSSPKQAIRSGIGMVHQEFALFSTLSVEENITLTREKSIRFTERLLGHNLACIDRKSNIATAVEMLESIGVLQNSACDLYGQSIQDLQARTDEIIHPESLTGTLSVSMRQFVEIAREMSRQDLILLLLDEPTAVLNKEESINLMAAVKKIAARGVSVIYVSHRIEEMVSLCDKVTVLRSGKIVGSLKRKENNKDIAIKKISRLMVGKDVIKAKRDPLDKGMAASVIDPPCNEVHKKNGDTIIITTSGFTVNKPGDRLNGLDLTIYKGEILGITGLSGHGRNALAPGIMGVHPTEGRISIYGKDITLSDHRNIARRMIDQNLWIVPEERQSLGLLMNHSIMENITFGAIHNKNMFTRGFSFFRTPDRSSCIMHAMDQVRNLDIQCRSIFQKTGELSGGNQQKVCIAAALTMSPDILFISEPTRGIDIAGKEAILKMLMKTHQDLGMTIIISSGELDELKRICDRIAIIYQGRLFDIFTPDRSDYDFAMAFSGLGTDF